jgi:hypothetical protein
MAIDLKLVTVTNSIAGLSISNVTVLDVDQIPPEAQNVRGPTLFPDPDGFVTDFSVTRDAWGTGVNSKLTVSYTLNYVFAFVPSGSGRGALDQYSGMIDAWVDVMDTILGSDTITGCVDIAPVGVPIFGTLQDPSGGTFTGCKLAFAVTELIN